MNLNSKSLFKLLCLTIVFLPTHFLIQEESLAQTKNTRPKIGLVLKGGGALGIAHVGVLKILDKYHVPVDMVAGTSMGSIVGAAFSSGCSLEEMERVLAETDWDELFGEKLKRKDLDYRMKSGRRRELYGDVKFSFQDGKFVMPQGVVEGQALRPLFQRLFGNQSVPLKFDKLPIPFRAVAADLESGEAYVPDGGDLSSIVRASMSVPGAFSPIDVDGRLLVDGGIVDNLPVDVVLKMGADILIVVDLQSELAKRQDLTSPISISGQMVSLLLAQNSAQSLKLVRPQDVVIGANVNGYTVTDFPRGRELIAIGEKSAEVMSAALKKLSISEEQYSEYKSRLHSRNELPPIISFVRIKNRSNVSEARIREQLALAEGEVFDLDKLEAATKRVYQSGYFSSVTYTILKEGDKSGVEIDANGRDWLDQFVRLGFSLEDNLDGDDAFRFGAAYRTLDVTSKDSYLEAQFEIGKSPRFSLELYQPFAEDSPYFISPILAVGRNFLTVRQDNEEVAEYSRTEEVATLLLGRSLGTIGEVTAGISRAFGDLERKVGDPTLPESDYDIGDVVAGIDLDNLDKPDFPTSGFRFASFFNAATESLGAPNDFQGLSGSLSVPLTFNRDTFLIRNSFATTFGDRPVERYNSLGGFLNVSGLPQSSLAATNFNSGSIVYFRRFSEVANPFFDLAFFGGLSYEATTIDNDNASFQDYHLINSGSIFFGADTPLLPVYLGFGVSDTDDRSVYIAFGRLGR